MIPLVLRGVGATILLLCSVMAGACPHIPPDKEATEKPGTMPTDTYKLSQAGEYPDLTAEEAGRLILNLVDGLKSMDELPLERVIERTGFPLKYAPAGNLHAFAVELDGNRGFYNVIYRDKNGRRFVEIRYAGREGAERSEVFPCVLGVTTLAERLKALGYIMNTDIDEIGRTLEHVFNRGRLSVRIVPSDRSMPSPLGIDTCVEVLSIQSKD